MNWMLLILERYLVTSPDQCQHFHCTFKKILETLLENNRFKEPPASKVCQDTSSGPCPLKHQHFFHVINCGKKCVGIFIHYWELEFDASIIHIRFLFVCWSDSKSTPFELLVSESLLYLEGITLSMTIDKNVNFSSPFYHLFHI